MKRKSRKLPDSSLQLNATMILRSKGNYKEIQKETKEKIGILGGTWFWVPAEMTRISVFCFSFLICLAAFFAFGQNVSFCSAEEGFSLKLQKSSDETEKSKQSESFEQSKEPERLEQPKQSGFSLEINIPGRGIVSEKKDFVEGPIALKNNADVNTVSGANGSSVINSGSNSNAVTGVNGNLNANGKSNEIGHNSEDANDKEMGVIDHKKQFKVVKKEGDSSKVDDEIPEGEGEDGFFRSQPLKKSGINKKTLFMQWKQERREAFKLRKKQDLGTRGDSFTQDPSVEISNFTARESVWGRFAPGSWCRIRTTSKAFKNFKPIRSITETTLTLESVDEMGYVLKKETAIIVGPNMLKRDPEYVRYDFWDVPVNEGAVIEDGGTVCLLISQKATPCKIRRILRKTDQYQEETMLYYSQVTAPHILKKEVRRFALEEDLSQGTSATPLNSSVMTVQKTAAHVFLGRKFSNYRSHTVTRQGTSIKLTVTEHNSDIPGGISKELITERDIGERLLYQATSIISEFHIEK